ncbi:CTB family bacteriocin [Anabaena azotica]|uniref:CTB family bacteriocin n=1 Tax=Anabaena azotica TaxID=197653 RepID=UPI0039A483AF
MSDYIDFKNPNLFVELSDQQQEIVSGGYSQYPFLLQLTKITSLSRNQISFLGTSDNTSISQESAYTSTELIIGMDSSFFGGNRRRRRNRSLNSLFNLLYRLFY